MKPFRAGEVVRPKNKLLPIDSEVDGRTGKRLQIKNGLDLLINTVTAQRDGEQLIVFRGVQGSYDSTFFERTLKK